MNDERATSERASDRATGRASVESSHARARLECAMNVMNDERRPSSVTKESPRLDEAREDETLTQTSFAYERDVERESQRGTFRVYATIDVARADSRSTETCYALCLHGCPSSAMSWAPCAEALRARGDARRLEIIAMDLRGHGATTCEDDDVYDADLMARDAFVVLSHVFDESKSSTRANVVVVGHSMGGAVAARLASLIESNERDCESGSSSMTLRGLVLVDIVEGSAIRALPAMRALAESRPKTFASMEDAEAWVSTRGGGTTNARSMALTLPSQLRAIDDSGRVGWRTNVLATEPYWTSWYRGLSKRFLATRAPKLLVLAGSDRLDTELTIAQMQGKFQMTLLPKAGHAIQEDDPEAVTTALENFIERYVFHPRPNPPSFSS